MSTNVPRGGCARYSALASLWAMTRRRAGGDRTATWACCMLPALLVSSIGLASLIGLIYSDFFGGDFSAALLAALVVIGALF